MLRLVSCVIAIREILIWVIEEKAIMVFRSVCREHTNLAKILPTNPNVIRIFCHDDFNFNAKAMNFIIPSPPILSRIPARIMDPSTGASTWAFGSHKCIKKTGILRRKINKEISQKLGFVCITLYMFILFELAS